MSRTTERVDGDVFVAIAHPLRRGLLDALSAGEQPVARLAAPFAVSRPAVSQHLRVLLDAGLVSEQRHGRERRYRLEPERLRQVGDWVAAYERFWSQRLAALGDYLERHTDQDAR
jgi:DNA-binding transcriptional ArsR family regulator